MTPSATRHSATRPTRPPAWRRRVRSAALLLAVLLGPAGAAWSQPSAGHASLPVAGQWLTKDQTTVLDIESCGAAVCGRIVGMTKWPRRGVPTDLHDVPECGMTIMRDFRHTENNLWQGDILDPDTGKDYTAELWLGDEGGLHLRGYVGLPLFGLTQVWTRYRYAPPPDCHLYAPAGR